MELDAIKKIISEQLSIPAETIGSDTTFEDLGADSLDIFQIISALEEEFSIEINLDDSESIQNIEDLFQYMKDIN